MNAVSTFLLGLGVTVVISLAIVLYLRPHLRRILVDLCGTEPRAEFWAAFSNVTLVLVPVIFAMWQRPSKPEVDVFFDVSSQLKWALLGLVSAVVVLGLVISRFIPRKY